MAHGFPGVETTITDLSIVLANQIQGIWCVQVISNRGVPGKEYLITNKTQLFHRIGSYHDTDLGVEMLTYALENKSIFRVTRALHYSTIEDITSVVGTEATVTGAIPSFSSLTESNSVADAAAGQDYFLLEFDLTNIFIPGATFDMTGSTGNDGTFIVDFTEFDGSETKVHTLETVTDGTVDGTITLDADATFEAEAVGQGYNGSTIEIVASSSGTLGNVDIFIKLQGSEVVENLIDIPAVSTTPTEIEAINAVLISLGVKLLTVTNYLPTGLLTLAGGIHDDTTVVAADWKGDANAKNGWHSFDSVTDSQRIINLNAPDPVIDQDLIAYVEGRQDMRAALRTPTGLNTTGINDYINGTGPFSHTPYNSIFASQWYTDVEINDRLNSKVPNFVISAFGHYMGKRTQMDQKGVWLTAAGEGNTINKINKIGINFDASGNQAQGGFLYLKSLNFIVKTDALGVVPWGNENTFNNKTKLTSKDNIADLVVFISREVKKIAKNKSFKPNDFVMFNELYREVLPFIYSLIDGRAIQGEPGGQRGEGLWWHWLGDQFAKTPSDLTFNDPLDIDNGIYKIRFAFKPIASNEFIIIDIAPADSVTILNVQVLNEL